MSPRKISEPLYPPQSDKIRSSVGARPFVAFQCPHLLSSVPYSPTISTPPTHNLTPSPILRNLNPFSDYIPFNFTSTTLPRHHHLSTQMSFASGVALRRAVAARPWLHKIVVPIAEKYNDLAGYRKVGLV